MIYYRTISPSTSETSGVSMCVRCRQTCGLATACAVTRGKRSNVLLLCHGEIGSMFLLCVDCHISETDITSGLCVHGQRSVQRLRPAFRTQAHDDQILKNSVIALQELVKQLVSEVRNLKKGNERSVLLTLWTTLYYSNK